ncbi:MAG TPA: sigma-54 dependent transcriptional regulator [Candidatus Wunengus sp. YC63]|uniref:sigma-54 dependent transcriptional regulator n=1 Tax=unclassified Candidatus Wunengus TaxID=3367695 RepID=UPI00402956FA
MGSKILVIDDEESIRYTFKSFLLDEGYEVLTAQGYQEALSAIDTAELDLIFADILLGGKTGLEVLREVKERNLRCPVVMITGDPDIDSASEALRLGAFDYIPKPIKQDTLLRITKIALKHKALVDEKERYRTNLEAIFSSVKDAIIAVDKELLILEMNDAARSICNLSHNSIGKAFNSIAKYCNGKCFDVLEETINKKQAIEVYRHECQLKERPQQVVSITSHPLLSKISKPTNSFSAKNEQGKIYQDNAGIFSGVILVVRDETRLANLEQDLRERQQFHNIIGKSEKMQAIYSLIDNLVDVETTVLITGETGTGKELIAEALHSRGSRCHKPLVKVNCSALSENLLESELFGHVKGAFSGAVQDRIGRFQRANGGTIFLDEIGDVSPRTQLQLLRVVQEKEFERVGDSTPIKVDVRIVAATNQSLQEKVSRGDFREDLYYRLKVVEVIMPPLRERKEDIPLLLNHFLNKFNKKLNKEIVAVSADVQKILMDYFWPGNVRELEHTLEHAFIICRQNTITIDCLPLALKDFIGTKIYASGDSGVDESHAILHALEKTSWNKARAARLLGMSRRTIYRKIKEFKIKMQRT